VVSRSAAKELTLKTDRNSDDIMALYELLEKTDKRAKETNTKLDNLTTEVSTLRTDVTTIRTDVTALQTDVTCIRTDLSNLDAKFEANFSRVNGRFDQLEELLAPRKDESAA